MKVCATTVQVAVKRAWLPLPLLSDFVGHKLKMRLIASRNGSNYSYSECSGDDRCHCCSLSASKDSLETSILEQHPRHFATHHKRHLQSAHSTQGCLLKPFAFLPWKLHQKFQRAGILHVSRTQNPINQESYVLSLSPCFEAFLLWQEMALLFCKPSEQNKSFVEVMENQWIGFPSGRLVDNLQTF